jgi:hypothetical protein
MPLYHCKKCQKKLSENKEEWGIEADGTRNSQYCCNCYQGGKISSLRIDETTLKKKINKIRQEIKDLIVDRNKKKIS